MAKRNNFIAEKDFWSIKRRLRELLQSPNMPLSEHHTRVLLFLLEDIFTHYLIEIVRKLFTSYQDCEQSKGWRKIRENCGGRDNYKKYACNYGFRNQHYHQEAD